MGQKQGAQLQALQYVHRVIRHQFGDDSGELAGPFELAQRQGQQTTEDGETGTVPVQVGEAEMEDAHALARMRFAGSLTRMGEDADPMSGMYEGRNHRSQVGGNAAASAEVVGRFRRQKTYVHGNLTAALRATKIM